MKYLVSISPEAGNDIRNIFNYIANDLLAWEYACTWLDKIEAAITGLQTLPERYPRFALERLHHSNIRRMPVANFLVFYNVDKKTRQITVLRIIYDKQDRGELF